MKLPFQAPLVAFLLLPVAAPIGQEGPPARELSRELSSAPRLAGTIGSLWGARVVSRHLEAAGWRVEPDERVVTLSLPRKLEIGLYEDDRSEEPLSFRSERFDAAAIPPGDVPLYNAWSASAEVRAPVVDVGFGLREDYERLAAAGVDVRGAIALARYGRSYRGVKVDLATEHGCVGTLLFSDPAGDGPAKGEVWPKGPWKPDTDGQRGSISPMGKVPGDPSTPGWASPGPGKEGRRLSEAELDASLPTIPCLPIGSREALAILAGLRSVEVTGESQPLGPGPLEVWLSIDQPRELHTIRSVIATLEGADEQLVIAGSHRDAWVRGAHDSGSGVVALLRAAQHLGQRAKAGWKPRHTLVLGLWDAEEYGLIGSTEWAEANGAMLSARTLAYVNADAAVSGTRFRASGTPGLMRTLKKSMQRVALGDQAPTDLWEQWVLNSGEEGPRFGLPGSGSDFAVFLHHLTIPVIDVGFGGNRGGQYHTAFDDFEMMDRFLDPGFEGHELAGRFLAQLLGDLADSERVFDDEEASLAMAEVARAAGREGSGEGQTPWLGEERGERLAQAFEAVASGSEANPGKATFYRALLETAGPGFTGLPDRPWYRNELWAPGLETGYSSETFPGLRLAASRSAEHLDTALAALISRLERLRGPASAPPASGSK